MGDSERLCLESADVVLVGHHIGGLQEYINKSGGGGLQEYINRTLR